jgi:hypothetical protein
MPGVGHLGVIWMNTDDFDGFLRELISSMGGPQPHRGTEVGIPGKM